MVIVAQGDVGARRRAGRIAVREIGVSPVLVLECFIRIGIMILTDAFHGHMTV